MAKKPRTRKSVETLKHDEAKPHKVKYARNTDLDPQLVWRGKDEQDWSDLVVHAPPLYIQEKVHPKALIDDLLRQTRESQHDAGILTPDLFADFNGMPKGADKTEFYAHDQNWSNRMILGDSLQVMASLAEREGLHGKVQCIYFDPPYGIKFNSNFQWSTTSHDVKDGKADHITREPEQVKAFRDTWRDGIHSYLTHLRDRLTVARDLLTDSGSIFVQISDENVHRVRAVMDEVFGQDNFCSQILFRTTGGQSNSLLASSFDILLWYAKSRTLIKYRPPLAEKPTGAAGSGQYVLLEDENGTQPPFTMTKKQKEGDDPLPAGFRVLAHDTLFSSGAPSDLKEQEYRYREALVRCPDNNHWKPGGRGPGMTRLDKANRFFFSARPCATNAFGTTSVLAILKTLGSTLGEVDSPTRSNILSRLLRVWFNAAFSWPPTLATSCSTRPAVPGPPLLLPSNGAAAGSRLTLRAWHWRWRAPASWARAIRFTCWLIPATARSRKPKSPSLRRVHGPCKEASASASSMSAYRTSRSSPSPTTRRSMSSGTSGRRSWGRCASRLTRRSRKPGRSGRFRARPMPSGRTWPRSCTRTGGRLASPGSRK